MTVQPDWVPPGIDTGKANVARVYDYLLGGTNNFRADQDAARAMLAVDPEMRGAMRANRAFLGRAVRYLTQAGIRQFLDIGSGIPTARNVHQVAQETGPGARVIYADVDEVAVAHSRLLLSGTPDATIIQADLRRPEKILADPAVQLMLDFTQPIAVLLVAVLHFIPDEDDPWQIVATLRDALAPGSFLVICHACRDAKPHLATATEKAYESKVASRAAIRSREDIARFFDGFTLVEPGLVYLPEWHPDSPADIPGDPRKYWGLVGVGQLPVEPSVAADRLKTLHSSADHDAREVRLAAPSAAPSDQGGRRHSRGAGARHGRHARTFSGAASVISGSAPLPLAVGHLSDSLRSFGSVSCLGGMPRVVWSTRMLGFHRLFAGQRRDQAPAARFTAEGAG